MPPMSPGNSQVRAPLGLEGLFGASPSLLPLLGGAKRAAQAAAPILILGESGTGRSSLARALHAASGRSENPWVEVDIGLIPSPLFESELFGYRAGAFTGASQDVPGRVAMAETGSLILDHVEEIPIAAQPKLLRLLSEGRYAPLGGSDTRADVRFLAVASDDLVDRVERGAFRRDLFYRLEVVTLRIPPVRDRPTDIPTLLEALLAELRERFGRGELRLTGSALEWMSAYAWPGNLREMRNCLERELILKPDGPLEPPRPADVGGKPAPLAELEREHILRVLAYSRGHQGRASEILGISRKTLWEKRKRYGLP